MAWYYGNKKIVAAFYGNKKVTAAYWGEFKIFPVGEIKVLKVWLNITASATNKPEEIEQQLITAEGYMPACGGIAATCNVQYEVEENGTIVQKWAFDVPLKEGAIEALYLDDTITETTLIGTRHIDLVVEGHGEIIDFEFQVYQQANIQTIKPDIVDVEPSGPYHRAEYLEPVVTLTYSAMGANGQNTYALVESINYYQDYETKDYNLSAVTHDEITYTSGKKIVTPQKGGVETDVVIQQQRYENEGADPFIWYMEDQETADVAFVNDANYNHAVKGKDRAKDPYTGGKVAKVTLIVPMNGKRGIAQVDIMQLANTMQEVWRDLPKFNEYESIFTDINISIFRYSSNTAWQIPASGTYQTPALVFSQDEYKDTYEIVGRTQKFNVWSSGAEEATDDYYGGTRTLKKHELVKTYGVADAESVMYSVDYWRNSGYWYNKSKGYVAAEDRADNPGDTRTLGVVTVTITMNGKTKSASVTLKQQYNREETDQSYWKEITPQSDRQYSYEYYDPVITSFSYTSTNFYAYGGTATPTYSVSQTRDEIVSYTKAVEQYMQVFTSHPDAPYARGTRGGEKISTIVESGQSVPSSEITVRFDGSVLNSSGVTLDSYITGKITVPSLGTNPTEARNVWTAKIIVTGPQKRAEKTLTIAQRENKIESQSGSALKSWRVGIYDHSGNDVTEIASVLNNSLVAKAFAIYSQTVTWSSRETSTIDGAEETINLKPSSNSEWLGVGSWNSTYSGYTLAANSNTLATSRSAMLTWTQSDGTYKRAYLTQRGVVMPKFNNCTTVGKVADNFFAVYSQSSNTPDGAIYTLFVLYYNEQTGSTTPDKTYSVSGTVTYKDKGGTSHSTVLNGARTSYLSTYGYYGVGVGGGLQVSWDIPNTKLTIT